MTLSIARTVVAGILSLGATVPLGADQTKVDEAKKDGPTAMPRYSVEVPRLRSFTIITNVSPSTGAMRYVLKEWPVGTDVITFLIGGGESGDEILSVDGVNVSAIARGRRGWAHELTGSASLEVRRQINRAYQTKVIDCVRYSR